MTAHVVAVDLVALLLVLIGFHMAFRQRFVRRLIGGKAARPRAESGAEDPLRYALLIFGIMILAFGIIVFGFTTFYAMLTQWPR